MNVPEAWAAPPFKLKVKPVLPDAVAVMLPLAAPGVDVAVVVPVTTIVTPAQGLGVGGGVVPPLLQPMYKKIKHKEENVITLYIFFININFCNNEFIKKKVALYIKI